MKKNYGKEWEAHFFRDWSQSFPRKFILRLKDDLSGYAGASANPSDFIAHLEDKVFLLEAKCCYGNTFNFHKLSQYDSLIEYRDNYDDTICAVVLWFIDHDTVVFVNISVIEQMKKDGLKSINIKKLKDYNIIRVPATKKRVFMTCDFNSIKEQMLDIPEKSKYTLQVDDKTLELESASIPEEIQQAPKDLPKMYVSDIWYQPIDKDSILIMIADENQNEYSIAEIEYEDHEHADYHDIYDLCLEIANDLGYELKEN